MFNHVIYDSKITMILDDYHYYDHSTGFLILTVLSV